MCNGWLKQAFSYLRGFSQWGCWFSQGMCQKEKFLTMLCVHMCKVSERILHCGCCKCRLNNKGIDLAMHPKTKVYFIFSGLMTLNWQRDFLSSVVALLSLWGLCLRSSCIPSHRDAHQPWNNWESHVHLPSLCSYLYRDAACCFCPVSFWYQIRLENSVMQTARMK